MKAVVGKQHGTADVLQVQTAQETRQASSSYLSTEGGKIAYSIQGSGRYDPRKVWAGAKQQSEPNQEVRAAA